MSESFFAAVRRGDLAAVRVALEQNPQLAREVAPADPDHPHAAGCTALHLAAREGHRALVPLLVLHGADLEARTAEGRTALHDAIESGHGEVQQALLGAGARMDICAAAILGHAGQVRSMLETDPVLANDRSTSLSPLGWASFGNQVDIARELLVRGARMDDGELLCAALVGHAEVGRLLIEHGADPNTIESRPGANALHAAATLRYTADANRFVQMLLEAGADPSIRTRDGRTALDIAEAGAREQAGSNDPERARRNFSGVIGLLRAAGG